jgi:hyperosmotically inducible protein
LAAGWAADPSTPENGISREVRHELLTLPFYTVFDTLTFREARGVVTLQGQVTRPILKSDSEKAVKHIEGVKRVNNQIEVLPLSAGDDRMRLDEYLAIYGDVGLNQYAVRSQPPIHIIVRNGNVTLEGTVDNADDKALAFTQASSVRGVVSVTDHLRVLR